MKKVFTLIMAACLIMPTFAQKQKNSITDLPIAKEVTAPQVKGDVIIEVTIVPDNYGSETTWEIINEINSTVVASGGPYVNGNTSPQTTSHTVNSDDCFTFIIYDQYGDGMNADYGVGSYTVKYNGVVFATGGSFGDADYVYGMGDGCATEEITFEEIIMAQYGTPNTDIPVSGVIKNMGTNNLTSFDVTYNIDGGENAATYNVSGVNVTLGNTYEFTHNIPVNIASSGNYEINVSVSNPNGITDNESDNALTHTLMLSDNPVQRTVLLEQFTTAECPMCPPASANIANWVSSQDNVIWIAHHAGYYTDDFTVPENTTLLAFFNAGGGTFAPAVMLDRTLLSPDGDPGPVFFPAASYTPGLITERVNTLSFVSLDISGIFNPTNRELDVNVSGTFLGDFTDDLRLGLYIIEDNLTGSQAGASGTYTHNHVMRDGLSDAYGDNVFSSTLTDDTFSENYTYSVNNEWNESNCKLVAFVAKWNSNVNNREILQAAAVNLDMLNASHTEFNAELDIYPNPSTGMLKITNVKDADIQIINQLGQVILEITDAKDLNVVDLNSMPNGTYFVKVIQNETVSTNKIILSK